MAQYYLGVWFRAEVVYSSEDSHLSRHYVIKNNTLPLSQIDTKDK